MKEYILVSACLLGEKCKYSGDSNYNQKVAEYLRETGAEIVPVCPEVMGGLSTPRMPAEIRDGSVYTQDGHDVTREFQKGAEETVKLAEKYGCRCTILKERSPSCGSGIIYDGSFSKTLTEGGGITAGYLKKLGIRVIGESEISLDRLIRYDRI